MYVYKGLALWFVLLLTRTVDGSSPCRYITSTNTLKCKGTVLSSVPGNFSPLTSTLIVHNTSMTTVDRETFSNYPSLRELQMYLNKITRVEKGAFNTLVNLKLLDLSNNHLTYLDQEMITTNLEIETLSLNYNPLESMPILSSQSLRNFKLKNCSLVKLPSDSFSKLPRLEMVDLRDNMLEHIPGDVFDGMPRLTTFYLGGNPWRCGPEFGAMVKKYSPRIGDRNPLVCTDKSTPRPFDVAVTSTTSVVQEETSVDSRKSTVKVEPTVDTGQIAGMEEAGWIPDSQLVPTSEGSVTRVTFTLVFVYVAFVCAIMIALGGLAWFLWKHIRSPIQMSDEGAGQPCIVRTTGTNNLANDIESGENAN